MFFELFQTFPHVVQKLVNFAKCSLMQFRSGSRCNAFLKVHSNVSPMCECMMMIKKIFIVKFIRGVAKMNCN